jgi:hypothetical protein
MNYVSMFKRELFALDPEAVDFSLLVDSLVTAVPEEQHTLLIPTIFRFFETFPLIHAGAPGTLVHFTESFYPEYVERLFESLKQCPSVSTVLMVNRILNSKLSGKERVQYLNALEVVAQNEAFPALVRNDARHFLEYQHERG